MRRAGGSYEAIGEEFGCSKSVAWHHTHDVKLDQSEENPETKPLDAKIRMSVPLEFSSQEILDLQNRARGRGFDSISDYLFHLESVAALQQRQSTMVVPAKPRDEFDVEIIETHHRMKKDAPSGTAKTLAEILKKARKIDNEIPTRSIREGDVVGEHTVVFAGPGERMELTHRASSREIIARGALRAAEWIVDKPPGLYSMQDVLGL